MALKWITNSEIRSILCKSNIHIRLIQVDSRNTVQYSYVHIGLINDRLIRIFVQHPNNKVIVVKKFYLVNACHVVRVGSQLVE